MSSNLSKSDGSELVLPTVQEVEQARSCAALLRYSAGALIVGGATVALTLLLAGTVVQKQVYLVLVSLYGGLVVLGAVLMRLTKPKPYRSGALVDSAVYTVTAAVYLVYAIETGISSKGWPVKPYTSSWWQIFAVALGAAFLGVFKRMNAESRLESLADAKKSLNKIEAIRRKALRQVDRTIVRNCSR